MDNEQALYWYRTTPMTVRQIEFDQFVNRRERKQAVRSLAISRIHAIKPPSMVPEWVLHSAFITVMGVIGTLAILEQNLLLAVPMIACSVLTMAFMVFSTQSTIRAAKDIQHTISGQREGIAFLDREREGLDAYMVIAEEREDALRSTPSTTEEILALIAEQVGVDMTQIRVAAGLQDQRVG